MNPGDGDMDPLFIHILPNHDQKLRNNLYRQRQNRQFCDLALRTSQANLLLHGCVMAAFSPKVASLLSVPHAELTPDRSDSQCQSHQYESHQCHSPAASNLVTIDVQFKYETLELVVSALYTGVFKISRTYLREVLSALEWLEISELILATKEFLNGKKMMSSSQCSKLPSKMKPSCSQISAQDDSSFECSDYSLTAAADSGFISLGKSQDNTDCMILSNVAAEIGDGDRGIPVKNEFEVNNEVEKTGNGDGEVIDDDMGFCDTSKCENVEPAMSSAKKRKKGKPIRIKIATKVSGVKKCKIYKPKERKRSKNTDTSLEIKQEPAESQPAVEMQSKVDECRTDPGKRSDLNPVLGAELDFILGRVDHIRCDKCFLKFSQLSEYHDHVSNHPVHPCLECDLVFYRKPNLTRHMRQLHEGNAHLKCRSCQYVAKFEKSLRRHALEVHNDKKPFVCGHEGCDYRSWKYDFVERHKLIHAEVKGFRCDKCGLSFAQYAGLTSHRRACYQLQEYLCDLCGQSFNHQQSMKSHRRTIHMGEKPHQCKECGNTFSDHRNLRRHMRIHENSFPYACHVCGQQFRHSNSLKSHMNRHKDTSNNHQVSSPPNTTNTEQDRNRLGGASYKKIRRNKGGKNKSVNRSLCQVAVIPPPSSSPPASTSTDGAAHHVTFDLTPGYLYSSQVAADVRQTGSGEETLSPSAQLSGLLLDRSLFNLYNPGVAVSHNSCDHSVVFGAQTSLPPTSLRRDQGDSDVTVCQSQPVHGPRVDVLSQPVLETNSLHCTTSNQ